MKKLLSSLFNVVLFVLMLIGLSGVPDDLEQWGTWMGALQGMITPEHLRWTLVLSAIGLLLGVNIVPRLWKNKPKKVILPASNDLSRIKNEKPELEEQVEPSIKLQLIKEPELTFPSNPTLLKDLFNHHQLEKGETKDCRFYKVAVKNLSLLKNVNHVTVELVNIEVLGLDKNNVPQHINADEPLELIKTKLPLVLCHSNHRDNPLASIGNLQPTSTHTYDVIRWQWDGTNQPTYYICQIRNDFTGELPIGSYKMTVRATADNVPSGSMSLVIEKPDIEGKCKWIEAKS